MPERTNVNEVVFVYEIRLPVNAIVELQLLVQLL